MAQTDTDQKTSKIVVMYHCKLREKARANLYLNNHLSDVNFVFREKAKITKSSGESEASNEETVCTPQKDAAAEPMKIIEKVPAHKFLLALACDAFNAMFYGPMKEEGDIEIVDASPEALKEFLQCFYMDKVQFTKENIEGVMYLADKYGVNDCMDTCVTFLMDTMTPDDLCWIYGLAIFYEHRDLQAFCKQQIALNAVQMFGSNDFLNCERKLLKKILSLQLMPCDETIILDSCLAWAKRSCERLGLDAQNVKNLRAQLGDCFSLIRFGTISIEELSKRTVVCGDLFNDNEWAELFHLITVKQYVSKRFIRTKRFWWNPANVWNCQRSATNSSAYYIASSEVIYVTSNKTTLLGGIYNATLSHRNGGAFSKDATITVTEIPGKSFDSEAGTTLYRGTIKFINGQVPYVKLPVAIMIDKRNTYEIRFDMPNFNDCYSSCVYNNKVDSGKGLSIEFIFDNGRGHMISSLDMNHL